MSAAPRGRVDEVLLEGGTANRGLVVRVGDTVRRPARATSPATAALLQHLADVGFEGAPRYLGVDEQGREVLSYVPGEAATVPLPDWALTDEALLSVAHLLRRYHDAVAGFDPTGHAWPLPVPDAFVTGLVAHNDPNLDNVVFRDARAVALIDFDLAGPGSRLWDLAAAARLWSPLRLDDDVDDARRGRQLQRSQLLVEAYGLDAADEARFTSAVLAHHDWSYHHVGEAASAGHTGFREYLSAGAAQRAERTRRWYAVR